MAIPYDRRRPHPSASPDAIVGVARSPRPMAGAMARWLDLLASDESRLDDARAEARVWLRREVTPGAMRGAVALYVRMRDDGTL